MDLLVLNLFADFRVLPFPFVTLFADHLILDCLVIILLSADLALSATFTINGLHMCLTAFCSLTIGCKEMFSFLNSKIRFSYICILYYTNDRDHKRSLTVKCKKS